MHGQQHKKKIKKEVDVQFPSLPFFSTRENNRRFLYVAACVREPVWKLRRNEKSSDTSWESNQDSWLILLITYSVLLKIILKQRVVHKNLAAVIHFHTINITRNLGNISWVTDISVGYVGNTENCRLNYKKSTFQRYGEKLISLKSQIKVKYKLTVGPTAVSDVIVNNITVTKRLPHGKDPAVRLGHGKRKVVLWCL